VSFGAHLLLLHELRVRTVINDMAPKDRGRERRINLFRTNVPELPIQDEFIALGAKVYSGLLSEKDKGKDVPIL
jgi:hypothetical protein